MEIFAGILGLIIFTGVLWLWSENRKEIKWRYPIILLGIMFAIAFVFTRTSFGVAIGSGIATFFGWLTTAAMNGITFVFNGTVKIGDTGTFLLQTLMPILFFSVLVGLLLKFGIFQQITKWVGKGLSKISGQDELLSFEAPNAFILSQSGIFVSAKEFINNLTERQILAMGLIGNSQISSTILGAYLGMLTPKYVITGTLLNLLVGLFAVNIVFPDNKSLEKENEIDMSFMMKKPEGNIFNVISNYATTGFHTVIAIAVSLMAFLGLIALLNQTFNGIFGTSFEQILGYVFSPIAWLMGSGSDSVQVGQLMATKFMSNEFVGIMNLQQMHLSSKATAIASVGLLSFANLSCIGIIGSAISAVSDKQSKVFFKKGLKVILVSFICSLITGTITGLMVF